MGPFLGFLGWGGRGEPRDTRPVAVGQGSGGVVAGEEQGDLDDQRPVQGGEGDAGHDDEEEAERWAHTVAHHSGVGGPSDYETIRNPSFSQMKICGKENHFKSEERCVKKMENGK